MNGQAVAADADISCRTFANAQLLPESWRAAAADSPVWCFNPALTRSADGWLFAYRVVLGDQSRRIALCQLDEEFAIVRGSSFGLSEQIRFDPAACYSERATSWFADPRLVWLESRLFLYFNSGWHDPHNHQFLVELDTSTLRPAAPARELVLAGARQPIEKNWMLFSAGGSFAVYSVAPHRVLAVDLRGSGDIRCSSLACLEWPAARGMASATLRGGAPPQAVGAHFTSFCHAIRQEASGPCYQAFAYRFQASPPFVPTHAPSRPLPLPAPGARRLPVLNPAIQQVVYPCGAAFHQGQWLLSYGINDEGCAIAMLPAHCVEAALLAVEPAPPGSV